MFKKILIGIIIALSLLGLYFRLFGTGTFSESEATTNPTFTPTFPSRTPSDIPQAKMSFTNKQIHLNLDGTIRTEVVLQANENRVTEVNLEIGYDPKVFDFISLEPIEFLMGNKVIVDKVDRTNGKITYHTQVDLTQTQPIMGSDGAAELVLRRINRDVTASEITILPSSFITAQGVHGNALVSTDKAQVILKAL